ncbi:MAG: DegT/DnrJ/EryC1/StrS family aminotransferase [Cypionkella sp.]
MIPFLDLQSQYRSIEPEIQNAVLATLRSGSYILGEPVECFEENFARFCGTKTAIGVNTGTSALHLALLAAGIGPGDEVITVSTTFVATVAAILYTGATPVLVDIDPVTWNMDPEQIAPAITERTRAILPVHLHGRLADMDAIRSIARVHELVVIEDAAQAHGAERGGRRAGSFGDIGCFSFYPGKNLGACGEAGGVVTNSDAYAETMRCLRDWGQKGKYNHVLEGYNFRMDSIQGAILDVKLRYLDDWTKGRRRVANAYHAGLAPEIERAAGPFGTDHACHVYAIRVPDRDDVRKRLEGVGVSTNVHYPRPVHLQPAYARLGYGKGDFPISEAFADTALSLPIYPELSSRDVSVVIEAVNQFATASSLVTA